jgi:hypothetical protein
METEIERTKRIIENGRELEAGRCLECNELLYILIDNSGGNTNLRFCLKAECPRYNIVVVK